MNSYPLQMQHNAWANHVVYAGFEGQAALMAAIQYDNHPLVERMHHLAAVERGFATVLQGAARERPDPPREWEPLLAYVDATSTMLIELAGDEARLERPHLVPWWGRELPGHELLSQVLAHSGQHRAELAWELARAGVNTGELDYIVWTIGGRPAPGEALKLGAQ